MIILKIALGNLRSNRKRTLLTLFGVIMSVGFAAFVCGIAFSAAGSVAGISDSDTRDAVLMLARGFIVAASVMSALMIYAAFSVSFDGRVETMGILSSLGMSDGQKCVMVLAEALIYGVCGSAAGIVLGLCAAKLIYKSMAGIIQSSYGALSAPFSVTPVCVLICAAIGIFAALAASFVPMMKLRRISVLDSLRGPTKVNISLRQGLVSRAAEKCFGRPGLLAGQNYYNHRGKYRAISLALSGGTTFFFAIYCFFMYPIRWNAEHGCSRDERLWTMFSASMVIAVLFILIFLICASGSAAVNIGARKRELAMLKSIGMQNSGLCGMMCIESVFLVYYCVVYGLLGSLLVDWMICSFFRIVSEPMLKFWYPVPLFFAFVLFDILVGVMFAVYSVCKVRRINIIQAVKNRR